MFFLISGDGCKGFSLLRSERLQSEYYFKVQVLSENKTAAQGLTFTIRIIREDYNIKSKDLSKSFKKANADKRRRFASIIATGKGIALAKFRAR